MTKKRINLEIKPQCDNCLYTQYPQELCKSMETNPCNNWRPAISFIRKEMDKIIEATKKKQNKEQK